MQYVWQFCRKRLVEIRCRRAVLPSPIFPCGDHTRTLFICYSKCGHYNVCESHLELCRCEFLAYGTFRHQLTPVEQSQLSLLFLLVHLLLARRQRLVIMYNYPPSSLNSIGRFFPRVLIILWMTAAAVGIIVAARQPKCLPGRASQTFWQIGLSCQLHRAIVSIAVVAL